jgi:hypothetical protein
LNALETGFDQRFDLFRRDRTALREVSDFGMDRHV